MSLNKALELVNKHYSTIESYLKNWEQNDSITDKSGTEYKRDFDLCLDDDGSEALLYNVMFIVSAGATENENDFESKLFNKIAKQMTVKDEMTLHKRITTNLINLNDIVEFNDGSIFFSKK